MAIVIRDKLIDSVLINIAKTLSKNKMKPATKMDALRYVLENYKAKGEYDIY